MQVLVVVPLAVLCSMMPPTPGRVAQGETGPAWQAVLDQEP